MHACLQSTIVCYFSFAILSYFVSAIVHLYFQERLQAAGLQRRARARMHVGSSWHAPCQLPASSIPLRGRLQTP